MPGNFMTDAPSTPTEPVAAENNQPQLRILTQYVKDLSFENPEAPDSLRGGSAAPAIDIGIDVQARTLSENTFEVVININGKASREDKITFIAELSYGGVFQLNNVAENEREPFLLIECPRLLFPFARRILADTTRDGGFPPLMLDPVDFAGLFRQQLAKRAAAVPGADTNGNADPAASN
jgi:preprotein translocase subunit SecB